MLPRGLLEPLTSLSSPPLLDSVVVGVIVTALALVCVYFFSVKKREGPSTVVTTISVPMDVQCTSSTTSPTVIGLEMESKHGDDAKI